MNYEQLHIYFETSPAMRLLQARNVAYVVAFLHGQFKQRRQLAIPHSELLPALATFREDLQELNPSALEAKPETYLTEWCDKRWLRRLLEAGRTEPLYQLTPYSEEVLEYLDRALHQEISFIGTESRLRTVIQLLDELVVGASGDPEVHLTRLRRDKAVIEEQIERIEREGVVSPFSPTRVREQFATAVDMLKQLQADFRAVEDKFKEITQRVQQRFVLGNETRGGILADALDSEDALKREDQGVSFFEFLRFIQSPREQDRLQTIIRSLLAIQDLVEQSQGLEVVRRMVTVLLAEAEKVVRTTRRLSSTLRRLLDLRVQEERRRVAELLREIRSLAATMNDDPPRENIALEVDAELEMTAPLSRVDWTPPPRFERMDLTEHIPDVDRKLEIFRSYAALRPIDWLGIRRRISDMFSLHDRFTLAALVEESHPAADVIDVLGYLETAHEQGHFIDRSAQETLYLDHGNDNQHWLVTVPLVTFVRREKHDG